VNWRRIKDVSEEQGLFKSKAVKRRGVFSVVHGWFLPYCFIFCSFPIYYRGGRFQCSAWLVLMRQRQPGNLFCIGNHYLHGKLLYASMTTCLDVLSKDFGPSDERREREREREKERERDVY
jgi:hypothetical protein